MVGVARAAAGDAFRPANQERNPMPSFKKRGLCSAEFTGRLIPGSKHFGDLHIGSKTVVRRENDEGVFIDSRGGQFGENFTHHPIRFGDKVGIPAVLWIFAFEGFSGNNRGVGGIQSKV